MQYQHASGNEALKALNGARDWSGLGLVLVERKRLNGLRPLLQDQVYLNLVGVLDVIARRVIAAKKESTSWQQPQLSCHWS
jgi:hypothetical protein